MIFQIFLGIFLGIILGFVPSLHINFIAYIFLNISFFLIFPDNFFLFLSLSIAHTITSYLPQTFFSVPNTENIMSLFPLHRMFLERKAYFAIFLCFVGSFFGSVFALFFLPLLYLLFSSLIGFNYFVSFAIIFTFLSFIYFEKNTKDKIIVLFILLSSSLLGLLTLKYNFFTKEPLFVCVMGLFTFPLLLKSIFEKPASVFQETRSDFSFSLKKSFILSVIGSLSSLFIILVPSFSSSQASTIVSRFKRELSSQEYVVLFSSITISALIFSYFLSMFFYKPRIGYYAILLSENLVLKKSDLVLFIVSVLLTVAITILILNSILKNIIIFINSQNLNKLNIIIFFICLMFVLIVSDFKSIPVLLLSIVIGFLPLLYNKSRVLLMAFIMFPTLLFYL